MKGLRAREVHEGLVDGERFHQGVRSSIMERTSRPAAAYFCMSGLMTVASGQAFRALNIGMAECTP